MINIALIGNPNCGKTTLFNTLTGSRQRVGNWTGVTNDKKQGSLIEDKNVVITDLPGVYSFQTNAPEEKICLEFLKKSHPNVIVNVVDATNLSRNLYLTCELINLGIPIIIALNMYDQIENSFIKIKIDEFSRLFGVPVIPISALKKTNLDLLINKAKNHRIIPFKIDFSKYKGDGQQEKIFSYIDKVLPSFVTKKHTRIRNFTQKMDDVLMHNLWGIPIFFCVMTLVYYLSINIGGIFGKLISNGFENLAQSTKYRLNLLGVSNWIISLLCDAVLGAIGGVFSFLPQILILFSLMAVIEDSGYAARATFLFDKFFQSFGLGGKSLIPMIVSCGCTVTGLMSTRIIEGQKERKMTIYLTPFMPCGAKTAVFAWFAQTFFNGNALIAASMYFLGILCVGIFGKILKKFKSFSSGNDFFIIEIPNLRFPSVINIYRVMVEKVKEFLTKAGITIFVVSVFLWLLKSVGLVGYVGDNVEQSFLYYIGNALKWIFYPLGFGNWQASVAVISGTFAKEAIVETMELLCSDVNAIFDAKYSAYAFMAFVLLSPPCIASLATAKRELGSAKSFLYMCLFQFCSAYLVALIINLTGFFVCAFGNLILSTILVIILIISVILSIKHLKQKKCASCKNCMLGEVKCNIKAKRYTI